MSMSTVVINVIGDVFVDIIASGLEAIPEWEKDTLATIRTFPGGSALNTVMHFTHYCQYNRVEDENNAEKTSIALYSAVGNDHFGKICINALNEVGPTLQNKVQIHVRQRSGSCIVLSGNQGRGFVTDRGVINNFQLDCWAASDFLSSSLRHTHIAGYYNCRRMRVGLLELLQSIQAAGQTISVTPQWDADEVWDGIREIASCITYLIANEKETCKVAHHESLEAAIDVLLKEYGIVSVIVTQGANGATLYILDEDKLNVKSYHVPGLPNVTVVDTTGAGDAFVAGILHYVVNNDVNLSDESCIQAMLQNGCKLGAAACTTISGSSAPSTYMSTTTT